MNSISTIKRLLLKRKKEVEEEIKEIEQDDPVLNNTTTPESSEPGTDSWMADVHGTAVAVRKNLQDMLIKITKSLKALNSGKYGKCDNCGKQIEQSRLAAMPTATLCISCSKKSTKK